MATPTTLPSSFVAGAALLASELNNLRGAFRILQVAGATTTTATSTTSGTYATTTLASSITPGFTSSKVAVLLSQHVWNPTASTEAKFRINRSGSTIYENNPMRSDAANLGTVWTAVILDSPATTSAITYTVEFARHSGTGTITTQVNSSTAGIILMEVSA